MRLSTFAQKADEPTLHVVLTLAVAIGLQLSLSNTLSFGAKYTVAGIEGLLVIVLLLPSLGDAFKRLMAFILMGLVCTANIVSLVLLVNILVNGGAVAGKDLLVSSVAIYITNIIVFGIVYWELDNNTVNVPDFNFAQFGDPREKSWRPTFFDYLYVSITNGTAFSPTDTLPLTHRAKALMTIQALAALMTVVLVTARAVNILG
ncbi:MAG: hypothetical protein JWO41_510 [Candidatus Saccharibacteria bacterium]|nr:hypothetical protein [Candidatus Saccharibacteria bacterium]